MFKRKYNFFILVGNVKFVEMFNDEKGRSRGCGIVEFEDTASAKQAIETMDRYSLNGREIVVKEVSFSNLILGIFNTYILHFMDFFLIHLLLMEIS